jgi:hypothetical protein
MSAKRNSAQSGQKASQLGATDRRKVPTGTTPELAAKTQNRGARTKKLRSLDKAPQAGHGASAAPSKASKQQLVLGLLSAPDGASISELIAATNWLPHSTRAVLSRLRKQGYIFDRQNAEGGARYRVLGTPPAQERT